MPIYELLKRQGSFEPEEVAMLDKVFEDVLRTLNLARRKDPMTEMVAKKIDELATADAGFRAPQGPHHSGVHPATTAANST
jgi:hypothetical protein